MDEFVSALPHVNATCNALSAVALCAGFIAIKRKRIDFHRRAMLTAFTFSAVFLVFYLTRQALSGHTEFIGPPAVRTVYLIILISHMILAVPVVPLSITLIVLGLRGRIERHRRLARWTFPIWLYVSVTGVIVYVLLYRLYPPA